MIYLLGEVAILLTLALLFGLFIGWLLWGQRRPVDAPGNPKVKTKVEPTGGLTKHKGPAAKPNWFSKPKEATKLPVEARLSGEIVELGQNGGLSETRNGT